MSFDITHLLEQWDYQPGQVVVRKFKGKDGREKIQLRVDLGILQMNADGRPDGKRPFGFNSLLEFYEARAQNPDHLDEQGRFFLRADDCSKLQLEALQYHHRYICKLQLEDFDGVLDDTSRNLRAFDFVVAHAESSEHAWSLQQFRPQVLMIHTRALASRRLLTQDFAGAIADIEEGLDRLREFYQEGDRLELMEQSPEMISLQRWLNDLKEQRPLSLREQLELDLADAVKREDYEKAAQVRDALRDLNGGK